MEVWDVLERGLAVGYEEIYATGTKNSPGDRRDLARNPERAHRDGLVDVGHENRVVAGHHECVAARDRLDIEKRDHGVVPVREACG